MTNGMMMLSEIGDICAKKGIHGVGDIPFTRNPSDISMSARDFLDILKEVYFAGARFERERAREDEG